jgi:hypothetical protein
MANIVKTPFSDQVGADSVPKKGTKGGEYEAYGRGIADLPGRDGSGTAPHLIYDTAVTSKDPSVSGIVKTMFKDAVD